MFRPPLGHHQVVLTSLKNTVHKHVVVFYTLYKIQCNKVFVLYFVQCVEDNYMFRPSLGPRQVVFTSLKNTVHKHEVVFYALYKIQCNKVFVLYFVARLKERGQ